MEGLRIVCVTLLDQSIILQNILNSSFVLDVGKESSVKQGVSVFSLVKSAECTCSGKGDEKQDDGNPD